MHNDSQPVRDEPEAARGRTGLVLAALCASAFMASLDVFIVNVAFDDIGRALPGASLQRLSWVLNGYAIAYAALLVPLGRLADRYGLRRSFLIGLALFTAANVACALSPNLWILVAFRVVQATGAAALTPASLGLLLTTTPPERRAAAVQLWAASGALAAAVGPTLGGLLVQQSWQWVFLVNLPVGVLALLATFLGIKGGNTTSAQPMPDFAGAVLLAAAIGALTLAVVMGPEWRWTAAPTAVALAVAAISTGVFAYRNHHHDTPIIEPALLRVRSTVWANVTGLLFSAAFGACLLGITLWMQQSWHYSALRTGLALAPGPLMVLPFALLGQRMARTIPTALIVAAGCLLLAAGSATMTLSLTSTPHYASVLLPAWMVVGAGFGLALPTILAAATKDLPEDRTATGSAVANMSRQIGTSLGVAALIAVLGAAPSSHSYDKAWWLVTAGAVLAGLTALQIGPLRRPAPPRERASAPTVSDRSAAPGR
ncbi:MFS transporter [Streptomyces sp. NPDC060205]|uniref:MFS transporter n=1 Tax=Streptomyces sp. NPDC060205 TaxID=3347072 RepID=UPI003653F903